MNFQYLSMLIDPVKTLEIMKIPANSRLHSNYWLSFQNYSLCVSSAKISKRNRAGKHLHLYLRKTLQTWVVLEPTSTPIGNL